MTNEEIETIVLGDPVLAHATRNVAAAMRRRYDTFGTPERLAAIAILFPVLVFVVRDIGLPWLHEGGRYLELWRLKFRDWIDEQYRKQGLDPEQAQEAGDALRRELVAVSDDGAQKSWERFAKLLREEAAKDRE